MWHIVKWYDFAYTCCQCGRQFEGTSSQEFPISINGIAKPRRSKCGIACYNLCVCVCASRIHVTVQWTLSGARYWRHYNFSSMQLVSLTHIMQFSCIMSSFPWLSHRCICGCDRLMSFSAIWTQKYTAWKQLWHRLVCMPNIRYIPLH